MSALRIFQSEIFRYLKILLLNQKTMFAESLCQIPLCLNIMTETEMIANKIISNGRRDLVCRRKIRKTLIFVITMEELSDRRSREERLML